jgi:hypothetical protein
MPARVLSIFMSCTAVALGSWPASFGASFQPLIQTGKTIFVADAHCDDKRFVVSGEEKPTAFLELEKGTQLPVVVR